MIHDMGARSYQNHRITADEFRTAMRKLPAGVTVITVASEGEIHGMTATAVCSVSIEPPTILIVVNRTTRTHPFIGRGRCFTVNILAEEQRTLANHFSGKHINQFDSVPYISGKSTGSPIILNSAAFIECNLLSQFDVETHTIFLGEVLNCGPSEAKPLVYYDGHYSGLNALEKC